MEGWKEVANKLDDGHLIAFNIFCTLWPCDIDLWPFGLILNG